VFHAWTCGRVRCCPVPGVTPAVTRHTRCAPAGPAPALPMFEDPAYRRCQHLQEARCCVVFGVCWLGTSGGPRKTYRPRGLSLSAFGAVPTGLRSPVIPTSDRETHLLTTRRAWVGVRQAAEFKSPDQPDIRLGLFASVLTRRLWPGDVYCRLVTEIVTFRADGLDHRPGRTGRSASPLLPD